MPWSRLYFYTSPISLVYLIYLLMQDDFILSLRNGDTRANSFIYCVEGGEKERDREGEEEDLETVYTLSVATEDRCVITMYARLGYRRIRSGNKIVRRTQILYKLLHFIRSLFRNRKVSKHTMDMLNLKTIFAIILTTAQNFP